MNMLTTITNGPSINCENPKPSTSSCYVGINLVDVMPLQAIDKAIAIFENSTKGIKQDAIDWITGNKRGIKQARAFIGLSKNNKMPAYTLAIPARESCPRGGKLAKIEGTVCHKCYAVKGHDGMQPAITAKQRRWDVIQLALESTIIYDLWFSAFTLCMTKESFFRWHSAGDLFSAAYVELVKECIEHTQWVNHWIPTKEPILSRPLAGLVNCALRLSTIWLTNYLTSLKALLVGSIHLLMVDADRLALLVKNCKMVAKIAGHVGLMMSRMFLIIFTNTFNTGALPLWNQ